MRKIRVLATITILLVAIMPGTVWAAPNVVSGFTISPGTVYAGNSISFAVSYKISVNNNDNVVCLYYDDAGWDGVLTGATATSARGASYTFRAAGTAVTGCDTPATWGRTRVAQWYAGPLSAIYRLLGDTLTIQGTLPGSGGPAAATHTFDVLQLEGAGCAAGGTCVVVDGGSSSVVVASAPTNIFVSNDATCGANSPCLTGPTALQTAYATVTDGGTINIVGTYSLGAGNTVNFTSKSVTLIGVGNPVLENGAGTCSGAMLNITSTVTIRNLTIDGSCGSGSRTNGLLVAGGATSVKNVTIRNFTGGQGLQTTGGTAVIEGSSFSNNNVALNAGTGTLYAFANNIPTNIALDAAVNIKTSDNVKCNYWAGYSVQGAGGVGGAGDQYEKRLGAPVSTYVEGPGALALGRGAIAAAASGNQVIVNMGRGTPPFNNGTVLGLGAQTSDFFAFCLTRNGSGFGAITVTSDAVAASVNGHRLYHIADTTLCSPSTNTACWSLAGANVQPSSVISAGGAVSAPLSPNSGLGTEGQYVIGNQVDPTAITLRDLSATPHAETSGLWVGLALACGLLLIVGWSLRRRAAQS